MKRKTWNGLLALLCGLALAITGCGQSTNDTAGTATNGAESAQTSDSQTAESGTRTVVDNVGRTVEVPTKAENIVAVGSMGPRMISYMELVDNLVGSEDCDQEGAKALRDYSVVYHEKLGALPSVGKGGGSGVNNAYAEPIIELQPDVIFAGFDKEAADELQRQTGIPVVSIRYKTVGFFEDTAFEDSLRLIGEITDREERAEEIADYIAEIKADLAGRVKDVPEEKKKRAYTGAVTWSGQHGFAYTYLDFPPFNAVQANNVADVLKEQEEYKQGAMGVELDWEQIPEWDPEVIFLDPGSMHLVNEEYNARPEYFESLRAVQNDEVYTMPSSNHMGPNVTYHLINAYHAGKVLYPEQFADVELAEKAGEIMEKMLGQDFFTEMQEAGLTYGKLKIGA
ncbi:hypothetical protein ACU19_09230 [Actinobaculum suis]|uniref:ABC transporter substrate-binding protein n=1 Tax=Actinobaculum suis TaxID=1657 RepID=UPI00066FDFE7|nr:ABC transporter substrate-binding protein [Actinobaculum suis]KMY22587.1 hypothetical protein ACU19_09230 [Actinobaculum suis]